MYVLAAIEHGTRKIRILGTTEHPVQAWVVQLDRTLIWNQRHLMIVPREYEDFCNSHRPHRALKQAAPLRPLPEAATDLDHFRVQRRDRAGGVIHEYRLVA
jgi:putative transposase